MYLRTVLAVSILSLAALGPACAPAEQAPDPAEVRAAIEEVNAQLTEAFNQGDAAAVAALYDENAISMPPNAKAAHGREAIQQSTAAELDQGVQLSLSTSEVEVAGGYAIEIGAYTTNAGDQQDEGKYLVVWKRQADGSWKLYRDIWNSDLPVPDDHEDDDDEEEPGSN